MWSSPITSIVAARCRGFSGSSTGCVEKYICLMYVLGRSSRNGTSRRLSLYSLSRRHMMKGTHEMPASVKQIFSFGNRAGTPVVTMLIKLAIIANVCATVCRASAVSNCSTLKGNTGILDLPRGVRGVLRSGHERAVE